MQIGLKIKTIKKNRLDFHYVFLNLILELISSLLSFKLFSLFFKQ